MSIIEAKIECEERIMNNTEIYDHEEEIRRIGMILNFAMTVHGVKSSIYKNAWRKRGWNSLKANYFRKIDAITNIFEANSYEKLNSYEKIVLTDNFIDLLVFSGLFVSFFTEKLHLNEKEILLDRISTNLGYTSTDIEMNKLKQLLEI